VAFSQKAAPGSVVPPSCTGNPSPSWATFSRPFGTFPGSYLYPGFLHAALDRSAYEAFSQKAAPASLVPPSCAGNPRSVGFQRHIVGTLGQFGKKVCAPKGASLEQTKPQAYRLTSKGQPSNLSNGQELCLYKVMAEDLNPLVRLPHQPKFREPTAVRG
jgi:hypothetical protein